MDDRMGFGGGQAAPELLFWVSLPDLPPVKKAAIIIGKDPK
jgi:hypothetical protein